MCSKNADRTYSLRRRLILSTIFTSGVWVLFAAVFVFVVSWHYLIGSAEQRIGRLVSDLQQEYTEYGGDTLQFRKSVDEDAEEHNPNETFVILSSSDGRAIYSTRMPDRLHDRILRAVAQGRREHRFYTRRASKDDRHVAIRLRTLPLADGKVITVACDVTDVERYLLFLAITLGSVFLLTVTGSGCHAWMFTSRFTRRLGDIAATATAIEQGDRSRRVEADDTRAREIRDLIRAFNGMCDKNENILHELRVLTDNIAHDLRTPLTRLSLAAEKTTTGGDPDVRLPSLVMDETSAMLEMINTMLEISQTDAKIETSPRVRLDFSELVRDLGEFFRPLAENEDIELAVTAPDRPVEFYGHRAKVQQLVSNLLENAIKYTPRGGRIEMTLSADTTALTLKVCDTGCGIPKENLDHVFQRFWRADSSRSLPGNGLGLALVKAIVTSYGGHVICESELGKGSTFTVVLPRV